MTRDEILNELSEILSKLFDLDKKDITLEANLYEDLDLDSIDAIDLVVQIQKKTGKKVKPEDFKSVRTVKDVVDAIEKLLNE